MAKVTHQVEIDDAVGEAEMREFMAKAIAIANRQKGFCQYFAIKAAVPVLAGTGMVLGLNSKGMIDVICQAQTQQTLPAGPLVGFYIILPAKV
jgi:hypothetical protein